MCNCYLTMDYYVAISFIIGHMGYNKCIKKQVYMYKVPLALGRNFK